MIKLIITGLSGALIGSLVTYLSLSTTPEAGDQFFNGSDIEESSQVDRKAIVVDQNKTPNQVDCGAYQKQIVKLNKELNKEESFVPERIEQVSNVPVKTYHESFKVDLSQVEDDIKAVYESAASQIIKNPIEYLKKSRLINDIESYSPFSGSFSGELYHLVGKNKGEVHRVEYSSNLESTGEKLNGSYLFVLEYQGKEYSRSRGSGDNNQIKTSVLGKGEITLEVAPASYLQVTSVTDSEIIGNYYSRFDYVGVMKLKKE